ncbi:LysR family transcriptional regulator [Actinoplanes sp. N902-109]|uniref:LysR family transcriptional regulator n=1 Tax=Actinoplanes sp. (strain N902-109) TaxID=649831 RepID=UPI00032947B2|nr:LysR family transcriptional regulator [Actinoplanes sp. N902-109]AGL17245.1 LysR family transcriptional regulator [Actinoplanes sp. N902-109]
MELRNLRAFATVARTLSVTRAARELHYAQSSVSEQILALERDLGVDLLDRSQRQVRLTAPGTVLAGYAERVFALLDEARTAVGQPVAELAVGAMETIGVHLLPPVLSDYHARHPGTRLRVVQHNRNRLYDAVAGGELDLCVTYGPAPTDPGLRTRVLAEEPLVVIVAPGHPLAGRGRAPLAELAGLAFLSTGRGCSFRQMFDATFAVEPVAELSSLGALGACVAAGMGCALLPSASVRAQAGRGEIAVVACADTFLRTDIMMSWRDRSTSAALPGFREVLSEHFARLPAG